MKTRFLEHPLGFVLGLFFLAGFGLCLEAQSPQNLTKVSAYTLPAKLPSPPRLVANAKDFERLETNLKNDSHVQTWYAVLKKEADRALTQTPYKYELRDGVRLLPVSRDILRRVSVLALVYKMEKNKVYLDRAFAELANAASFPDWHPSHFLDTAELAFAFALAYDWLYADLNTEQKSLLRLHLRTFALEEALKVYKSKKGWPQVQHNWNFVCNGGILNAALAIADEDPEPLRLLLPEVLASVPRALSSYAPEGAWNESPAYWDYGTSYLVFLLSSLENSLGTSFGLSESPGFESTGDFARYLSGPGNYQFGFGDIGSSRSRVSSEALWYLARTFSKPELARYRRDTVGSKPEALDLLWYDRKFLLADKVLGKTDGGSFAPRNAQGERVRGEQNQRLTGAEEGTQTAANQVGTSAEPPLDRLFRGVEVATFRSSWTDPDALFAGIKGTGFTERNHTDLDNGSFFLACFGEIWANDLGSDDYNLTGYFNMSLNTKSPQMRWDYYRKRAEGHNTLVINPGRSAVRDSPIRPGLTPDQDPRALALAENFRSTSDGGQVIINLSAIYPDSVSLKRGLHLFDGRTRVLVQDEISLKEAGEILWFMHLLPGLKVEISPDGSRVRLSKIKEGRELRVDVLLLDDSEDLSFELRPAAPLATSPQIKQNENKDSSKLVLRAKNKKDLTLRVLFVPSAGTQTPDLNAPAFTALNEW